MKKLSLFMAVIILALSFTGCSKQIKKKSFDEAMQNLNYAETQTNTEIKHLDEACAYTNGTGTTVTYMQFDKSDNAELWIYALRQVDKLSIFEDKIQHSDTRNCDYTCIRAQRDYSAQNGYSYAIIIECENVVIEIEDTTGNIDECTKVKEALGF